MKKTLLFTIMVILTPVILFGQVLYETQELQNPDAISGEYRGISVSICENMLIAGAYLDASGVSGGGSVYVYMQNQMSSEWELFSKVIPEGISIGDEFGRQVSTDSKRFVSGAHMTDENGPDVGCAYVFEYGNGTWNGIKLNADDGQAYDHFGRAVSISGDFIVVGAMDDDNENGENAGAAYLYQFNGYEWNQILKILAPDGSSGDSFGQAVSISGDQMVISAIYNDENGNNSGAVYVYEIEMGSWQYKQKLLPSHGEAYARFGNAVSIDEDKIVAAAFWEDALGEDSGAAYVFERDETNWVQTARLTSIATSAGDNFGGSVGISDKMVVIGSVYDDFNNDVYNSGGAYVFSKTDSGWTEQLLMANNVQSSDAFGRGVAIHDGRVAIGAFRSDVNAEDSGNLYFFNIDSEQPVQNVLCEVKLDLFPNPVESELFIECELEKYDLIIVDSEGHVVYVDRQLSGGQRIQLDELAPGKYNLICKNENAFLVEILVKI